MLDKTNKEALSKLLEDGVECLTSTPPNTATVIIDVIAMLQMITRVPDRFADLAEMLLTETLTLTGTATRVDFVTDQYPDLSIKNTEKRKRVHPFCHKQSSSALPSPNGTNKIRLIHFLVNKWSTSKYAENIGLCRTHLNS